MNTNYETLNVEKSGDFITLSVNREKSLNALNSQVLLDLKDLLTSLNESVETLKGMVVTGAGEKAFIAGADIVEMSDMSVDEAHDFATLGQEVTFLFEELRRSCASGTNEDWPSTASWSGRTEGR